MTRRIQRPAAYLLRCGARSIRGRVESFNAAVSGAILLYEIRRQRDQDVGRQKAKVDSWQAMVSCPTRHERTLRSSMCCASCMAHNGGRRSTTRPTAYHPAVKKVSGYAQPQRGQGSA